MLFSESKSTDKVPGVKEILLAKIVWETGLSKTWSNKKLFKFKKVIDKQKLTINFSQII